MRFARDWVPVLLWMGAIFYGSSRPTLPGPLGQQDPMGELLRAAIHIAEYAVLSALTYRAAMGTAVGRDLALAWSSPHFGRSPDARLLIAVLAISFGYALFDELHQSFVPGRCFSLVDLGLDAVGIVGGVSLASRWRGWLARPSGGGAGPDPNRQV